MFLFDRVFPEYLDLPVHEARLVRLVKKVKLVTPVYQEQLAKGYSNLSISDGSVLLLINRETQEILELLVSQDVLEHRYNY